MAAVENLAYAPLAKQETAKKKSHLERVVSGVPGANVPGRRAKDNPGLGVLLFWNARNEGVGGGTDRKESKPLKEEKQRD